VKGETSNVRKEKTAYLQATGDEKNNKSLQQKNKTDLLSKQICFLGEFTQRFP